jgi:hypothetical protein
VNFSLEIIFLLLLLDIIFSSEKQILILFLNVMYSLFSFVNTYPKILLTKVHLIVEFSSQSSLVSLLLTN